MRLRILTEAQLELEAGVDYYNKECPGLGYEFADEIYCTIDRIMDSQEAWHPLSKRTRRCLTHRFPYAVIYQYRTDFLLIVSIMHLHRHPDTWKGRTEA